MRSGSAIPTSGVRVNRRISGSDLVWPLPWLQHLLSQELPLAQCVSVGCGLGYVERELITRGIASHIIAVDTAEAPLTFARSARDAKVFHLTGSNTSTPMRGSS